MTLQDWNSMAQDALNATTTWKGILYGDEVKVPRSVEDKLKEENDLTGILPQVLTDKELEAVNTTRLNTFFERNQCVIKRGLKKDVYQKFIKSLETRYTYSSFPNIRTNLA